MFEYKDYTYVIDVDSYCYTINNRNDEEDYAGRVTFDELGIDTFDTNEIRIVNVKDKYKSLLHQQLSLITDIKLIIDILQEWYNSKLDEYMKVVSYDLKMCTNLIKYIASKLNEINSSNGVITRANNLVALDHMDKERFMEFCNYTVQTLSEDIIFERRGYDSLEKILNSLNYSNLFINAAYKLDNLTYVIFEDTHRSIVYDSNTSSYRKMTQEDIKILEKEFKHIEVIDIPNHRISAIGAVLYESEWTPEKELEGHLLVYLFDLDKYFGVTDYNTDDMLDIVEVFIHFTNHKDNSADLNIIERMLTMEEYKPAKRLQYFSTVEAETGYLIGFNEGYMLGYTDRNT